MEQRYSSAVGKDRLTVMFPLIFQIVVYCLMLNVGSSYTEPVESRHLSTSQGSTSIRWLFSPPFSKLCLDGCRPAKEISS